MAVRQFTRAGHAVSVYDLRSQSNMSALHSKPGIGSVGATDHVATAPRPEPAQASQASEERVGWSGAWSDRLVARNLLPDDNVIGVIQGLSFSADGNVLCCPTNPASFILYDTSALHTMAPPSTYDTLEQFPSLSRILALPATGSAIYATRSVGLFPQPFSRHIQILACVHDACDRERRWSDSIL